MIETLRDRVAKVIADGICGYSAGDVDDIADAVLAIPEIANALATKVAILNVKPSVE